MHRKTDQELITLYNQFVKKQMEIFADKSCPYFIIDTSLLRKISVDHKEIWESLRIESDKFVSNKLWEQIFSKNIRKYRPSKKSTEAEGLKKRINFNSTSPIDRQESRDIRSVEKIHDSATFLSLCRNKGFNLPAAQMKWFEQEEMILPILIKDSINYYAVYQLYSLMYLEEWKQSTLEYPNPTVYESQVFKLKPVLWPDYLTWNKKNLIFETVNFNTIVPLILDLRDLDARFFMEAVREMGKKDPTTPLKSKLIDGYTSHYTALVGEYYADKLEKKHKISEDVAKYWIRVFVNKAIQLNPFIRYASRFPMLSLSKRFEGASSKVNYALVNPIKLSNWCLDVARHLIFYIECKTGEMLAMEEVIDSISLFEEKNEKMCQVCGRVFIPNPARTGGRVQKICDREECKKEFNRKYMKEYRKKT